MAPGPARRLDALGILSVGALGGWALHVGGPDAGRFAGLLAGLVVVATAGRWIARLQPGAVEAAVAAAVAVAVVVTIPGIAGAGGDPTGYGNANATLVGVGLFAAVAAARGQPHRGRWRWVLVVGLAIALVVTGSVAGAICVALAGALAVGADRARYPLVVVLGGPILVLLALAATVAVGAGHLRGLAEVDETRAALWDAAVEIVQRDPWSGAGIGGFAARNLVSADADLRWVHHEYLEVAVELGVVGLVLLLAVVGSAFARLSAVARPAALGAVLTVVALHGTVDHVWHAPAVLVVAAALLGAGTATPSKWAERTIVGPDGGS